jgi:hypothetical protein
MVTLMSSAECMVLCQGCMDSTPGCLLHPQFCITFGNVYYCRQNGWRAEGMLLVWFQADSAVPGAVLLLLARVLAGEVWNWRLLRPHGLEPCRYEVAMVVRPGGNQHALAVCLESYQRTPATHARVSAVNFGVAPHR